MAINRAGAVVIEDREGREREHYNLPYGAVLAIEDGGVVESGQSLAEWDPYNFPILTEIAGVVRFKDIESGVTMHEEVEEVSGLSRQVIIQSQDEKKHPQFLVLNEQGKVDAARSSCRCTRR